MEERTLTDEEAIRARQRQSAVEWVVVFLGAGVAVGFLTQRPLPWIAGAVFAAGLAVARGVVHAQWAAGRIGGGLALALHVGLLFVAGLGLWALVAVTA